MVQKDIVRKLKEGNVSAFESIYRESSRELYYIAMGYLNDKDAAEDILQECFIYLWNNRKQIDPQYPISNYLRKAVKNYSLNYIRSLKTREKHEENIVREIEFNNSEEVDISTKIEAIRKVVESLPENCRKVFVMTVMEGLSYKMTAEKLDVSVNTVKSQVKIAYKRIKDSLHDTPDNKALMVSFIILLKNFL